MAYCSNCGSKIEDNDLFCGTCGAKQEGSSSTENTNHQFTNDKTYEERQGGNGSFNNTQTERTNDFSRAITNNLNLSDAFKILKNTVINPVSGSKHFLETSEKNTVIAITVFLTILQGLLGIWKINQLISNLQNIIVDLFQKLSALSSLAGQSNSSSSLTSNELLELSTKISQMKSFLNIPYGKIFLQNCVIFLIAIAILFIVTYLCISLINKTKFDHFTLYKAVLIIAVPTLFFEALSILLSYLSLYLGLGVAVIGVLISISTLTILLKDNFLVNENLSVFIVAVSFIFTIAAVIIAFNNFIYSDLSDVVTSVINSLKSFSF